MNDSPRQPLTVDAWLHWAHENARQRGLPDLVPLLDTLAAAMRTVRHADWRPDDAARDADPTTP